VRFRVRLKRAEPASAGQLARIHLQKMRSCHALIYRFVYLLKRRTLFAFVQVRPIETRKSPCSLIADICVILYFSKEKAGYIPFAKGAEYRARDSSRDDKKDLSSLSIFVVTIRFFHILRYGPSVRNYFYVSNDIVYFYRSIYITSQYIDDM